jgi:hypothetical protein
MTHVRQSKPDYGCGLKVKLRGLFEVVLSLLGSGQPCVDWQSRGEGAYAPGKGGTSATPRDSETELETARDRVIEREREGARKSALLREREGGKGGGRGGGGERERERNIESSTDGHS